MFFGFVCRFYIVLEVINLVFVSFGMGGKVGWVLVVIMILWVFNIWLFIFIFYGDISFV